MSAVKLERTGPASFRLFLDGHEISDVVSVDTSRLIRPQELPELVIVFRPDSFEITELR